MNIGNVEVYYTRGLFFRYPNTGEMFASTFADLHAIVAKGNIIDIHCANGKYVINFTSPLEVINFATLLDGLCAIDARGPYQSILQVWLCIEKQISRLCMLKMSDTGYS